MWGQTINFFQYSFHNSFNWEGFTPFTTHERSQCKPYTRNLDLYTEIIGSEGFSCPTWEIICISPTYKTMNINPRII